LPHQSKHNKDLLCPGQLFPLTTIKTPLKTKVMMQASKQAAAAPAPATTTTTAAAEAGKMRTKFNLGRTNLFVTLCPS